MLETGLRLGPYEIIDRLGAGGMGEVYRARDVRLDRQIAIKVLPPHLADDSMALMRFQREARAIASLSHPNIVAIHDVGSESGVHFAVTELLRGMTLRARINAGPIPWRETVEIGIEIASGLASAHARGVVHRDLKPENIFMTEDDRVKILDFGLAQTVQGPSIGATDDTSPLSGIHTHPGTVMGTIGYMAPEQLRGMPVDAVSDQFALGCVLLEMITGKRSFNRATGIDTLAAILTAEPEGIEDLPRLVPRELQAILVRCLDKEPRNRFPDVNELAAHLKSIMSGSVSEDLPASLRNIAPQRRPDKKKKKIDSIAVLPFVNTSADPGGDYLCDGITDTIINSLAQLPKLRVMASSTVFRYKGTEADPMTVGNRLSVEAVLTGRVTILGDRLSLHTELVSVADGSRIWGEQYSRTISDIMDIQQEIASEICGSLRIRMTRETRRRLKRRYSRDSEAYRLYLKGRFQWERRTIDSIRRAITCYEEAIEADPTFALAYAGIADSWVTLATNVPLPPREAMPKARMAAIRALELDPDLAEAHVSLASVKWWHEWNHAEAENELRAAIALNPNLAQAHDAYSLVLAEMEEFERAMKEIERARELDPLSLIIETHVGLPALFSGRTEEAIHQFEQTLELDPAFIPALGWLGIALARKEDWEGAIRVCRRALEVENLSILKASMGHALAMAGRTDEARVHLAALEKDAATRYVSPYDFAVLHAGLRDTDKAIASLEAALADRSTWMVFLRVDHRLNPIRSDSRFEDLLSRTGLLRR